MKNNNNNKEKIASKSEFYQQELFEREKSESSLKITINKNKSTLTYQQKRFNNLTAKIQDLNDTLKAAEISLENDLQYYSNKIRPRTDFYYSLINQIALSFWKLKLKFKLSQARNYFLADFIPSSILNSCNYLIQEPNEEQQKILNFYGYSNERNSESEFDFENELDSIKNASKEEQELFKIFMENIFHELGIHMKAEEIDLNNIDGLNDLLKDKAHQKYTNKKSGKNTTKSKKAQKQIEEEKIKFKHINQIYKELAKFAHPDLETDPERKKWKEELMKEIAVSYQEKDLLKLLQLELKWLNYDENSIEMLEDDKLKLYNKMLSDQVHALEDEIYSLEMHPRFYNMHVFVNAFSPYELYYSENVNRQTLNEALEVVELNITSMQNFIKTADLCKSKREANTIIDEIMEKNDY